MKTKYVIYRLITAASSVLVLAAATGCTGTSGAGPGSGPGSAYTAFEGDPGDWQGGEAIASIPCGQDLVDIWSFWIDEGQELLVTVDSFDPDWAFDPTLSLMIDDPSQSGFDPQVFGEGDDEMDCSAAPPSGACPRVQVTSSGSGMVYTVIGEKDVCIGAGGLYRMLVEVDGQPAPLTIEEDDNSLFGEDEGGEEHHP